MNGLDGVLAPDGVLGTEFLSKPYTLDVLAERVRALLDQHKGM